MKWKNLTLGLKTSVIVFVITLISTLTFTVIVHQYLKKSETQLLYNFWRSQTLFWEKSFAKSLESDNSLKTFKYFVQSLDFPESSMIILWADNQPVFHNNPEIQNMIKKAMVNKKTKFKDIEDIERLLTNKQNIFKENNINLLNNNVELFFSFNIKNKGYQLFVSTEKFKNNKINQIVISLYLIAFIVSFLVFISSLIFTRRINRSLARLLYGAENYINHGIKPNIKSKSEDEVGMLTDYFTEIINQKNKGLKSSRHEQSKSIENEEDIIRYLQSKLFEKPFTKMQNVEILLYPKDPSANLESFFAANSNNGFCDFLLGHFETLSIESTIWKHRIQELFYVMTREGVEQDKIAKAIHKEFRGLTQFAPSMLLGRLDFKAKKGGFFKTGNIDLFEIDKKRKLNKIITGNEHFSANFSEIESIPIKNDTEIVLICPQALKLIKKNISNPIESFDILNSGSSSKHTLLDILNSVSSQLNSISGDSDITGIVSVISAKN
ncbi:MAG: hypothetical protein OEZ13_11665 [Spirochaetia bacterium]|nr:hypothetical protein [Spirochaetia bacterium]